MKKLLKHSQSSSIMQIEIKREGDKPFKFNLHEEIQIDEDNLNKGLMEQPSAQAYIGMIHKELIKRLANAKVNESKAYAHAYLKNKSKTNTETGRPNSDDVAKAKAELDTGYLMKQRIVINLQHQVNNLDTCVKAFEQRKDILQTLSANQRKEK